MISNDVINSYFLLNASLAELHLPIPSRLQRILETGFSLPSEHLVGLLGVGPHLLDITGTTRSISPVNLNSSGLLEGIYDFLSAHSTTCTYIEYLELVAISVEHTLHSLYMCLGKVNDIDIVADTCTVGRIVVVAEHLELLTYSHSGLCDVGDKIHWHTVGQLTDDGCGVRTNGVEISEQDGLDRRTTVDIVAYDFLVHLLGIAIGAFGWLDGSILCYRKIFGVGLALYGAA